MAFHNVGFDASLFPGGGLGSGGSQGGFGGLGLGGSFALSGGNPLLAAGIFGGGQLLSGLGSLIGGPSRSQKLSRNLFSSAQGQLGQQVFNPFSFLGNIQAAMRPQLQRQAQGLSNRLGISSPLAQAGLAQLNSSTFADILNKLQLQSVQLQTQRDIALRRIMLGAAAQA